MNKLTPISENKHITNDLFVKIVVDFCHINWAGDVVLGAYSLKCNYYQFQHLNYKFPKTFYHGSYFILAMNKFIAYEKASSYIKGPKYPRKDLSRWEP